MALTRIRQNQVIDLEFELQQIKNQIKTFKEPVALFTDLPIEDNNDGDMRVCLEDGNIYIWSEINQEWNLSSGKGGAYTRTLSFDIIQDGQTEINTKIRFDETTDLQTTVELVNLYLNGMLVTSENYVVKNISDELVIEWKSSEKLLQDDIISVQYYDTTGGISQGSGGVSKYEHPDTHPANMIVFNDGETFEDKLANGTLKGEKGESGVSVINDNSNLNTEVWSANKVNTEIENLKQSVSNGKQLIATAITDKGVEASSNDGFNQLFQKINKIETLKVNGSEDIIVRAGEILSNGDLVTIKDSGNGLNSISFDAAFDETDTSQYLKIFSSYDCNKVAITVLPMENSINPKGLIVYNKSVMDDNAYTYSEFVSGNDIPVKTLYADFSRNGKYLSVISTVEPYIELFKLNESEDKFYKLNNVIQINEMSNDFNNNINSAISCVFTVDSKYLLVYCSTSNNPIILVYKLENDKLIPHKIINNFIKEGDSGSLISGNGNGNMFVSPKGTLIGISTNLRSSTYPYTLSFLKYDIELEEFNLINLNSSNVVLNDGDSLTISRSVLSISFTPDEKYIIICVDGLSAGPILFKYDNDTFTKTTLPNYSSGLAQSSIITKNGYVFISNRTHKLTQYRYSNEVFTQYSIKYEGEYPSSSSIYTAALGVDGFGAIISRKIQAFERKGTIASKISNFSDISADNNDGIAIVKQDCTYNQASYAKKILDI